MQNLHQNNEAVVKCFFHFNNLDFQLEQHDNCIYDYLEFRDGDQMDSPLIGRFCGYSLPKNIKSSGNIMRIKFASDPSVEKAGFSIKFVKGKQFECSQELF